MRAFVDVEIANQGAGPGDAAVCRVEQADLRFFIGGDGFHHLDADLLPGRTAGDEVLFDHPLQEALAHHRGLVDLAGRCQHALGDIRRRSRRDAVDHVVRAGRVLLDPGQQLVVAERLDELHEPAARAVTVMAQVVAAEQRHRTTILLHARFQHHGECAVDRRPGVTRLDRRQVVGDIGCRGIEHVLRIEVVTGFGHREGDDLRLRIGRPGDQRLDARLEGNDFLDRGDPDVVVLVRWRDRLQRVFALLFDERVDRLGHVRADVAASEAPLRITRLAQHVEVERLVRAVEGTQADVQPDPGFSSVRHTRLL